MIILESLLITIMVSIQSAQIPDVHSHFIVITKPIPIQILSSLETAVFML
jgi:hypothetical protein